MANWRQVWSARGLPEPAPGVSVEPLKMALRLDGYDTAMAKGLTPDAMRDLAAEWGNRVAFDPGDSVYEVGCGAGAFLAAVADVHEPSQSAGSDYSRSLVTSGRALFPWIDLEVHEGSQIPTEPRYTHVTCVGAFMYFSDLDYSAEVLDRMIAKSMRTVSILDVPDLSTKASSEAFRHQGHSDSDYEERYRGLDHLYFDRSWFLDHLAESEWHVEVADQAVEGYSNSGFRFNVFAQRRMLT